MSNHKAEASLSAYEKMHERIVTKKKPKRKKVKAKREPQAIGNPKIELRALQFYFMAVKGLSRRAMAGLLGVSDDTIARRLREPEFLEQYDRGRSEREVWLRDLQDRTAEAGSAQMQIFLGKNELGQSEKVENTHSGPGGGPIALSGLENISTEQLMVLVEISNVLQGGAPKPAEIEGDAQAG